MTDYIYNPLRGSNIDAVGTGGGSSPTSSSSVTNDSTVTGVTVTDALNTVDTELTTLANKTFKITYYEIIDISISTSGSLQSTPAGATINESQFGEAGNSVLSTLTGQSTPTFESPLNTGGTSITANLSNIGDWVSSDLYVDPVAIIYSINITLNDWANLNQSNVIDLVEDKGTQLSQRIIVNQENAATTLGGIINSSREYFIDGSIDLGTTQITVPVTGMTLKGYSFDISGLYSSEDNYTMFISESPAIGSGNVLGVDYFISVTGTGSQVYDLYDATGFNAFEFQRINYNNCTSLGELHNYRQGLESGTGRFGGSPSLCLTGNWLGGFRITTSITRGMSDTTTEPLFKAGPGFTMNSRFITDMNCDLGDLQPFLDFTPSNFPVSSTLELVDMIMTRGGSLSPNDTNITPNISASDSSSNWRNNNGVNNTFIGAIGEITTEIETTIPSVNTYVPIEGTLSTFDLQHFDSPANGQLRHLGSNPREYTVNFDFILEGSANREYTIALTKNDGSDTIVYEQTRVINNLQGGRDVAYFTGLANIILNQGEYAYWQVKNIINNNNCTLESGAGWSIEER